MGTTWWESEHQTKSRKKIMTNTLKWRNKQQAFLTHKQAPWTILSALFSQVDQQPVWIGTNVKLHPLYWTIVALFDDVHNLYIICTYKFEARPVTDLISKRYQTWGLISKRYQTWGLISKRYQTWGLISKRYQTSGWLRFDICQIMHG